MWNVLTDVVLWEWFRIRLYRFRSLLSGPIVLPTGCEYLFHLNRSTARQLKNDIERRYFDGTLETGRPSIFSGYGLSLPDDLDCEREGMRYLSRQAEHFTGPDDRIIIMHELHG
jgi:hypothetical protein